MCDLTDDAAYQALLDHLARLMTPADLKRALAEILADAGYDPPGE